MTMPPALHRFVLAAHITASVGWLGAVAVFLVLAIVGLASPDPQTVRVTYVVMAPVGWSVLVPLSLTALLTGLVQALGTGRGLLRHYWVLTKLLINLGAVAVLLEYMLTLSTVANRVAGSTLRAEDLAELRTDAIGHPALALPLLLAATALAVYKPWGMTRYGQRKLREQRAHAGMR
jgi:hypothetical protein